MALGFGVLSGAVLLAAIISAFIVHVVRGRADMLGLVQTVNHRSSHTAPTPSGGGAGIAAGTAAGALGVGLFAPQLLMPLAIALSIAALGYADDLHNLPAKTRLFAQGLAVGTLVILLALPALIAVFGTGMGLLAAGALTLAGMWWINLYNFIDGIDGYAAMEALFVLGALSVAAELGDIGFVTTPLFGLVAVSAAAIAGFLAFNWPPAKIFMGDVGSTFLGIWLFALGLLAVVSGYVPIWPLVIFTALFWLDASVTLLVRAARRENIVEAHKSHAYQILSRRWGGHRPVVLAGLAVNMLVLLPLGLVAATYPATGLPLAGMTALAGGALVFRLGVGRPDPTR